MLTNVALGIWRRVETQGVSGGELLSKMPFWTDGVDEVGAGVPDAVVAARAHCDCGSFLSSHTTPSSSATRFRRVVTWSASLSLESANKEPPEVKEARSEDAHIK